MKKIKRSSIKVHAKKQTFSEIIDKNKKLKHMHHDEYMKGVYDTIIWLVDSKVIDSDYAGHLYCELEHNKHMTDDGASKG